MSFSIYGKQLVERQRQKTVPVLGAPEFAPQESPDSDGSTGSTDTGALSSTSVEDTSAEEPEPGGDLDETMNDEATQHNCITHQPVVPKRVGELQMDLNVCVGVVCGKCKFGGFGR